MDTPCRFSRLLLCTASLVLASACATHKPPPSVFNRARLNQDWYLARKSPAVYFPRGVPANHSMEGSDGVFIAHGPNQSCFFVPHDLHAKAPPLIAEALSWQDLQAVQAAKAEESLHDSEGYSKEAKAASALRIAVALTMCIPAIIITRDKCDPGYLADMVNSAR